MIADHGASRLAVLHDTENVWEMAEKGQHSGRCCPKSEAVKRIATAYLKLLFPNVRTASDVNPKEFMKYCLRPAIKMRKIIWRQLSILDAEYKNDDKLMPEFTLKEIRNEA